MGMALRSQLLIALVVPALLVLITVVWLAEVSASASLEAALGRRLVAVAQGAAQLVPARLVRVQAGDDEARTVRNARRRLASLARTTEVARLVVVDLADNGVLVDSEGEFVVRQPFLRGAADAYELRRVKDGRGVASVLFKGPRGRAYKSGYAPLSNEDGEVVASVAASAPADYTAALDALRANVFGAGMIGMALLILSALAVARWVSVPLAQLARGAKGIAEGNLKARMPVRGPAEARVLAATMNRMSDALNDRDARMQMMLAGIAHEVRNPLGGIELFGGLLQEDLPEDDPRRKYADRILMELRTLSRVVNDFLEYARERAPVRLRTSLADLVSDACEVVQGQEGHCRVRTDEVSEAYVEADPDRLRSAVLNVLRNACQAAGPEGNVVVRVNANGQTVALTVEDSGPGIPPEQRTQIFEPFFTTKQKGTGLGLALVQKTIREHLGAIEVGASILGGARFTIRLPRASSVVSESDGSSAGHR
ncbi:MAG: ATP-binding protein [Myxococcota bacterium]